MEGYQVSSKVSKSSDFKHLLALAMTEKYQIAGAMTLRLVTSGMSLMLPYILKSGVEHLIATSPEEQKKALNALCLFMSVLFVLDSLGAVALNYFILQLATRLSIKLRGMVFKSVVQQEIAFFDKTRTGELVSRLSHDCQLVITSITTNMAMWLHAMCLAIGGVAIMFHLSPSLAFSTFLGIIPWVLWLWFHKSKAEAASKKVQDSLADASSLTEEMLSNIRTVRSLAKEAFVVADYQKKLETVGHMRDRESYIQTVISGMSDVLAPTILVTIAVVGGYQLADGSISTPTLSSFIIYSLQVVLSFEQVSLLFADINKGIGVSSRLWELIDKKPELLITGGLIPTEECRGHVVFKNVNFSYPSRPGDHVIKDLDLEIPANTVCALVGVSGAGKSTIADLLLRKYESDSGQILLDNVDIRELDSSWLRNQIGTVQQEPVLFNASIKENILYGVKDGQTITDEQIKSVAEECNIHDFIMTFPDGYNTLVGEGGLMLSGGQKQRIAITRAIINNPAILLLDEATSALDADSENEITIGLERFMKGRSVITIAHRLSTIKNADLIAVVESGKVIELGSFAELMELKGSFHSLVGHQKDE